MQVYAWLTALWNGIPRADRPLAGVESPSPVPEVAEANPWEIVGTFRDDQIGRKYVVDHGPDSLVRMGDANVLGRDESFADAERGRSKAADDPEDAMKLASAADAVRILLNRKGVTGE